MKHVAVIVDTNLIFSALISRESAIREILLESPITFYAPNYILIELFKHKEKILHFCKIEESEFYLLFNGIIEKIRFIPLDFISIESRQRAYDLCKDVDIKDTSFISLAIEVNALLWTADKKLKNGLRKKGFDQFFVPY